MPRTISVHLFSLPYRQLHVQVAFIQSLFTSGSRSPTSPVKEPKLASTAAAEPILDLVLDLKVTVNSGHCILHPDLTEQDEQDSKAHKNR